MVILGDGEMEQQTVSLRARSGDQIADIPLEQFVADLRNEIDSKVSQPALVPPSEA